MTKPFTYSLLAGIASAGLFLLVMGLQLGFFFMFLPTLPLLLIGMGSASNAAFNGALIAGVIVMLVAGLPASVLFMLFLGLPAWYAASKALLSRQERDSERQWFPIGLIFTRLTLYACLAVAALIAHYASREGGVGQVLTEQLHAELGAADAEFAVAIGILANQWAFLVFSITVWLWGLALYAHTWIAHRLLKSRQKSIRPDVAVATFAMPNWMLWLLALSALASLIGSPTLQLLGKSCLISLLLPYFLLGAAHMHAASASWPSRRFFLFFIYALIFAQFWPALAIAGVGIWQHIKRLSGQASSSKS